MFFRQTTGVPGRENLHHEPVNTDRAEPHHPKLASGGFRPADALEYKQQGSPGSGPYSLASHGVPQIPAPHSFHDDLSYRSSLGNYFELPLRAREATQVSHQGRATSSWPSQTGLGRVGTVQMPPSRDPSSVGSVTVPANSDATGSSGVDDNGEDQEDLTSWTIV
ncbi:unnamed protein product [Clonostachys rosea f. rosea IK726]|uniref:Uncharacterized protein n=1 Tax=Clonostachys rosea f. rosea IK726 TaxID=1349383 RepID=A0ACA9TRK4_BIOOC|nr:unnamed protein product [Clonostachys rosea f. rosea IK726]